MKYFFPTLLLILTHNTFASLSPSTKVQYKVSLGGCPAQTTAELTLDLLEHYENNKSLRSLKKRIIKNDLSSKYYISQYDIGFNPTYNRLQFNYHCPTPLAKIQFYDEKGESHLGILVDSGRIYNLEFETLLRKENKLAYSLPSVALPVNFLDKDIQRKITSLLGQAELDFRKDFSEIILDQKQEMTLILSFAKKPLSVFMGNGLWEEKMKKLQKIVRYFSTQEKQPSVINLTNLEKIVVKFPQ